MLSWCQERQLYLRRFFPGPSLWPNPWAKFESISKFSFSWASRVVSSKAFGHAKVFGFWLGLVRHSVILYRRLTSDSQQSSGLAHLCQCRGHRHTPQGLCSALSEAVYLLGACPIMQRPCARPCSSPAVPSGSAVLCDLTITGRFLSTEICMRETGLHKKCIHILSGCFLLRRRLVYSVWDCCHSPVQRHSLFLPARISALVTLAWGAMMKGMIKGETTAFCH